ncbi:MAG TPA: multiheme c-type cytochrome [Nitrospirota bacterium]
MKTCADCHPTKTSSTGHSTAAVNRHIAHVDCTACHIDSYGKGVSTEMSRDWTRPVWNPAGCEGQGAYVGTETRGTNVIPEFRFWNKTSWVFDRNGTSGLTTDLIDGGLAMSYPLGGIKDKLYPFKVHTSNNPIDSTSGKTNFDVLKMFMTGCYDQAAVSGLSYIGESGAYAWTQNKAFQLITHGVAPATTVTCTKCHGDTRANLDPTTVSKMDKLGYQLKDTAAKICSQCHLQKTPRTHESMHGHLTKGTKGIDCYFCHTFTRPERNLCSPCDPACVSEYVDTNPYPHICPAP